MGARRQSFTNSFLRVMTAPEPLDRASRRLLWATGLALIAYALLSIAGLPQQATEAIRQAKMPSGHATTPAAHAAEHPSCWTAAPFVLLLLAIAVLPLLPAAEHWWESNLHRFYVAGSLAAVTLAYYLFCRGFPLDAEWPAPHRTLPAASGVNLAIARDVLTRAVMGEYVPFILLLFGLYTISGGIRMDAALPAHPRTNAIFLAVGALLASAIGTTGAAMLLIRPLLETNRQRKHVVHTLVFFIFIVCNCGGCLLPTGDPPLFLGYLLGVPFFWTLTLWPEWLFVNGCLVAIYYLWDRLWYYAREPADAIARDETRTHRLRFRGLWSNGLLLAASVAAVALLDPGKPLPGTAWHPWLYLREMVLLALIALSLLLGHRGARRANQFGYGPIIEVAVLFFGIFICMQPPLEILKSQGPQLGLSTPAHFFWSTGALSSVLDNAPTYVVFFAAARSLGGGTAATAGVAAPLLVAISLGAVFLGAMTYIGNGPNFMARAIAQQAGIRMPGFFGYMLYSGLILLPLFLLTMFLFVR
jgi:Na+/H+ antiporter NhaD/arsenite permease-like protein